MLKGFQDLRVWQEAKDFTILMYKLTRSFPGSVSENISHVLIAKELKYLSPEVAIDLNTRLESIKQMINAMINSVSDRAKTFPK